MVSGGPGQIIQMIDWPAMIDTKTPNVKTICDIISLVCHCQDRTKNAHERKQLSIQSTCVPSISNIML
jgi:hypothetical protein